MVPKTKMVNIETFQIAEDIKCVYLFVIRMEES